MLYTLKPHHEPCSTLTHAPNSTPLTCSPARIGAAQIQQMAAMAVMEVSRGVETIQTSVAECGGIAQCVVLLRYESGSVGDARARAAEAVKAEAAGAVWVLADAHAANKSSVASSGGLTPLVQLLSTGGARAQEHAINALASLSMQAADNQRAIATLLVAQLGSGSVESRSRAAVALWRVVQENPSSHATIAASGSASDLITLLKEGANDARAFALWSLSLSISTDNQHVILDAGGESCLVHYLESSAMFEREQAAMALARLTEGSAVAQTAVAAAGGIAPLIEMLDASSRQTIAAREAAAAAISSLCNVPSNRDATVEARGVSPLVALLCTGNDRGQTNAAAALAHLASSTDPNVPAAIADAGAISPLVKLLTGNHGPAAQEEAAGALFALANHAGNRLSITDAGGIGPLVLLLGSTNSGAREHAEGALVRLSIENANRELIIHKLVSMLHDKGNGGEEQAAAALANLASDSADNRKSIVEAGGIAPLLSLLESTSPGARENAISAISQLAHNATIQRAIAEEGGVPLLANTLVASSSNVKEMISGSRLYSLSAFAVAQLARGNRDTQLALADAGAIPPLVAMLASPNVEMQAQAAGALSGLSADNADNQAAVARTGAIAPLCALVREGAPSVKEQSARALWSLATDNAANKATVAKLGGIEPLVGLLVSGGSDASLDSSVAALRSLAAKHAENAEAIAKMLVARLGSRIATAGVGAVRVLSAFASLCHENAHNQLAIARAGGIPLVVTWLSGSLDGRPPLSADAQREAAHALFAIATNNAPLQAQIARSEGIPPLIGLVRNGDLQTQDFAARALWHLAGSGESVSAIAELGGMEALVQMLAVDDTHAQELGAVVVSRLTRSHADKVAEAGGILPLVHLIKRGSPAAQQHAASALADVGRLPPYRDAIAFEAHGIAPLVALLDSTVVGTAETAARALSHLARDMLECPDDGGATEPTEPHASFRPDETDGPPGAERRHLLHASGGVQRLIKMLWAVPNKSMAKRMWDLVASVLGEQPLNELADESGKEPRKKESAERQESSTKRDGNERDESSGEDDQTGSDGALTPEQAAEQAAAALADLAYGDEAMQDAIIDADGVAPLLRLIRVGSRVAQEHAARAIWHLCARTDNQGALVECGAVGELVELSKKGSSRAQELAAAVISDLAKGAIAEREKAIEEGGAVAQPSAEPRDHYLNSPFVPPVPPIMAPTAVSTSAFAPPLLVTPPMTPPRGEPTDGLDAIDEVEDEGNAVYPADRLSAIAAAGGIVPLVGLVSTGSQIGKTRAASALWHLSANSANVVAIAKAGGIAPLVTVLDDGSPEGHVFAAGALAHLAKNYPENQAQIAKKLVGLLDVPKVDAQKRAAHALWKLAESNPGAPVRVVNAGAISPLVALLGTGTLEAKHEAAGALSTLAKNYKGAQLAIATGLVALLGTGSAEAKEHVTRMLVSLALNPFNRDAIVEAGAIERLILQLHCGGETSIVAQSLATTVLLHLTADSEANVGLVVTHGGIAPLTELLSTDDAEAQMQSAAVLRAMSRKSAEAQGKIASQGAIEPLVHLLSPEYATGVRAEAASALHSLASDSGEIQGAIGGTDAIHQLVALLNEADASAQREASRALASLAVGASSIQERIASSGGVRALVELLSADHNDEVHAAAASALSQIARGHVANQSAVAIGISPLIDILRSSRAELAQEEAAAALWSLSAAHGANQTAVADAGGITPLVDLIGAGNERAQLESASALAALALDHDINRPVIAEQLVALLARDETNLVTCAKAARAISRLARSHPSNQVALAAAGGLVPLVRMLNTTPGTAPTTPVDDGQMTPHMTPLPTPNSTARGTARGSARGSARGEPHGVITSTANNLLRELSCALWSMADANSTNQESIAAEGGVPSLISLLGRDTASVHRDAAGVLWSLAAAPSNQKLITSEGGIPRLVRLLTAGSASAQETAAGALHSLAALSENRVVIADAGGIIALVALFERGSPLAKSEAAGALASVVVSNSDNQTAVANELVAKLTTGADALVKPAGRISRELIGGDRAGKTAFAAEHVTKLIHQLSLEAENRAALSKAGAIPQLAVQLRSGTPAAMTAAAGALAQIANRSAQHRVQVTAQLIKLLGSEAEEVRQRAWSALKDMAAEGGAETMTVAMAGGIERFTALLVDGSLEAQEYALWLLCQSTDHASRVAIAHSNCAKPIIKVFISGTLSAVAQEHAAAVLARLASPIGGVADYVRASNHKEILQCGGIAPLVKLLRTGSDGAKRHAATALTQLSCTASPDVEMALTGGDGSMTSLPSPTKVRAADRDWSHLMQTEMAQAGAITSFVEWLFDPSLGRPELAAQALAHIAMGSTVSQVTIAEEGAIAPLVGMLHARDNVDSQTWAACALAALAETNAPNQIAIAEEEGIAPLIELLRQPRTAPHENATRALRHLADDADNKIAIAREGGLAPIVRMLGDEATECGQEWAAAALEALSKECPENQMALSRAGAIAPLVELLGSTSEEAQERAQGALLHIAAPNADGRSNVIRPLVGHLSVRSTVAQMKAAESLAILAARSAANRAAIAVAGAIVPLVGLLGDGRNVSTSQVHAAAGLCDLARASENKSAIVTAGGVAPLVRMLASSHPGAQSHACGALAHLASTAAAQQLIAEHNGIVSLVGHLASERVVTAHAAAQALWHLAVAVTNKATVVKAGGIPKLVALLERPDATDGCESVAAVLAELARNSSQGLNSQKAIVAAGGIRPLVATLQLSGCPVAHKHAACALWGLTDAPAHQAAAVAAGIVPPLVALLRTASEAQGYAAAALCNVARDTNARRAIVDAGGLEPLTELARGSSSVTPWLKSQATGILELLDADGATPPSAVAAIHAAAPAIGLAAATKKLQSRLHLALAPTVSANLSSSTSVRQAPPLIAAGDSTSGAAAISERPAMGKAQKRAVTRPPLSTTSASSEAAEAPTAGVTSMPPTIPEANGSRGGSRTSSRASSPRAASPRHATSGVSSGISSKASSRAPSPRPPSAAVSRAASPRPTGAASKSSSRAPSRVPSRAPSPRGVKSDALGKNSVKSAVAEAAAKKLMSKSGALKGGAANKGRAVSPRPPRAASPRVHKPTVA